LAAPFFSFLSVNFSQGSVSDPRSSLPRRARGWKEGQTLAFLIDFLDSAGNVAYRFYYQDTPFAPPYFHSIRNLVRLGLDPAPREVDMAILCVATANFAKNYFQKVDRNLRARHYLLTHWEDFFKGYTLDAPSLTAVNVTNPEGVIEDLRCQVGVGASWVLPAPGTILP
jgi:hypothetical protein